MWYIELNQSPSFMNPEKIHHALVHTLTKHDTSQQGKKSYNFHALGHYMARANDIMKDIEAGANIREAIIAGFSGNILTKCLKAVGEPKATEDEISRQVYFYQPLKYIAPEEKENN